MLQPTDSELEVRFRFDNPWWTKGQGVDAPYQAMPRRTYFTPFLRRVQSSQLRRANLLMGPRRVGKTVMLYQTIQALLDGGVPGDRILFLSLETPLYTGRSLERLLRLFMQLHRHDTGAPLWVFFDEIQYLKDWEVHLKSLVDSFRAVNFVGSGSAAAALRMKSQESGAGRFSDFLLPPLTFEEYLRFTQREDALVFALPDMPGQAPQYACPDITALNAAFVEYLNVGGYPEAVTRPEVRADTAQYLRSDIIEKVLLRDLPSLYGIRDIQELNRFFNTLAYNTAQEVSPTKLAASSGVESQTLQKYLEYLEAAFLVRRVYRVDSTAKRLQRERSFKVYLTNPAMRAALFGPIAADSPATGALVETAIYSQWLHNANFHDSLHFARWKSGQTILEVDLVSLHRGTLKPRFVVEIKWSDRAWHDAGELRGLRAFCRENPPGRTPLVTTLTAEGKRNIDGMDVEFTPSSLHCYTVARNSVPRE